MICHYFRRRIRVLTSSVETGVCPNILVLCIFAYYKRKYNGQTADVLTRLNLSPLFKCIYLGSFLKLCYWYPIRLFRLELKHSIVSHLYTNEVNLRNCNSYLFIFKFKHLHHTSNFEIPIQDIELNKKLYPI